jgi:hypothetical protein
MDLGNWGWLILLVASLATGWIGGVTGAWLARKLAPPDECDYLPVAVSAVDGLAAMSHKSTDVLLRCERHGELSAVTLVGRWTLGQVIGRLEFAADPEPGPAAEPAPAGHE